MLLRHLPKLSVVSQIIMGFLSVVALSFFIFIKPVQAVIPATVDSTVNGSTLYTYDTACNTSVLKQQQAFIIPTNSGTVDTIYIHFHDSANVTAQALCNPASDHNLCTAATTLSKNGIQPAIILSLENTGSITKEDRTCALNEAIGKINYVAKTESDTYVLSATGDGSTKVKQYLEQGFKANKTLLFDGCLGDTCDKIAARASSGRISIYASNSTLAATSKTYQAFPTKIFALKTNASATPALCYLDHAMNNACNGTATPVVIPLINAYGIGQSCTTDNDCPKDLDCEDSNVDTDGDGTDNDFCVCRTPLHCTEAYNLEAPAEYWECKDGTGIAQAHALHYCVSSKSTTKYPLQTIDKDNGFDTSLTNDLIRAYENTPLTENEILSLLQKPTPKIRIPGLQFSDLTVNGKLSSDEAGTVFLDIPFIGEYIKAIYNYLLLIAGVVCVVRIIVGGFLYATPDTSGDSKSAALKMIGHAIVGLFLGISSYTILYLFNPDLVEFKNLRVFFAHPVNLDRIVPLVQSNGTVLANPFGAGGGGVASGGAGTTAISKDFHYASAAVAAKLSDQNVKDIASKVGIDQCLLWAFVNKESGGNLHAIGHDENYASVAKPVGARRDFLLSGKKYSGATFTPPASSIADWEAKGGYAKLNNYTTGNGKILNNDTFQLSKPPDYGLDWRFSHGISFMQITIFPTHSGTDNRTGAKIDGPNGPEWARSIYGRWYTISDLLNPDTSIEAALRFITGGETKASSCGTLSNAATAFQCLRVSDPAMWYALNYYDKCPLNKGMEVTEADRQKYCSGKYRGKGCTVK